MHLRFLCHSHRSLIEQSSSRALGVWDLSQQKALLFQQRGEPEKAIVAAGGALEAAEVLLTLHGQAAAADLSRFTDAACLTLRLLRGLRKPELTRRLLGGCIATLQTQMTSDAQQQAALACCRKLLETNAEGEVRDHADPVPGRQVAWNRHLH